MEYRILGPIEVLDAGTPVEIGYGKPLSLLALLVLHANEVVSSDRIVEELWDGQAPPSAPKIVQNAVSQLRRALSGGSLVTRGGGYVLEVKAGERDIDRFTSLLADGRRLLADGEAARAHGVLVEALSLWRGPPLAEAAYESFAQREIARLEELRLEALEERIEADLALSRHEEVVSELEALVREQPLRERLRRQLMLALYRCGRQAAALQVYQDTRQALVNELGIEPGRALQELERGILNQDPALDAPAPPEAAQRRRRARAVIVLGAGAVVLAAAAATVRLFGGDEPFELASVAANSVGIVDRASARLVGQVPVPGGPALVATGDGLVWIESETSNTLTVLDETTRAIKRVVVPGGPIGDMVVTRDAVWLIDPGGRRLTEIDPAYGQVARRIRLPARAESDVPRTAPATPSVAAAAGVIWVTDGTTRLLRVDRRTGTVRSSDLGVGLDGVDARGRRVWAISGPSAVAIEVDFASGAVRARVPIAGRSDSLAPFPVAVVIAESGVWVLNANTATLARIDPELRAVAATIALGVDRAPVDLAADAGAVWTANRGDGTISRIDSSGEQETITLGQDLAAVAVGATSVWASARRGLVGTVVPPGPALGTPGALPSSLCSRVHYVGAGTPEALVAVPLSLQGFGAQASAQMIAAIQLVFEQRNYRAGRFRVGFQACNDAERASGFPTPERCVTNAREYVAHRRVLGIVGPVYSACAQAMLPIANAAPGGPLGIVSGLNTYVGLTRSGPPAEEGEPARYYPSGRRSYVRLTPADDVQSAGAAAFAERLGLERPFVLDDGTVYGKALASAFRSAAEGLGVEIAGTAAWKHEAPTHAALARRVQGSGADGVFLAGAFRIGSTLLVDLRAALGPDVPLLGSDGFQIVYKEIDNLGREIEGLYITSLGAPLASLAPTSRTYVAALAKRLGRPPESFTVQTAAAAEVMLDAIGRSDGTRASVSRALLRTKLAKGILGPVTFTATGDTKGRLVTISQISRGRPVVRAVLDAPAALASR